MEGFGRHGQHAAGLVRDRVVDRAASVAAIASDIEAPPCPAGLSGLLADADPHTSQLVVLDSLLPPVLYENGEDWRKAWAAR